MSPAVNTVRIMNSIRNAPFRPFVIGIMLVLKLVLTVFGFVQVGNLENVSSNLAQKMNRITNVQFIASAPLVQNRC